MDLYRAQSQQLYHSFTCDQTRAIPAFTPSHRASPPFGLYSLHLPTEGWPGWVDLSGWLDPHRELIPDMVTHPSTNQSQCRAASLIWPTSLPTAPNCHHNNVVFTTRSIYASAVLRIVILSLHHTRALWRNERTYWRYFNIAWKVIILVFWHQQRLVGDVAYHVKFALKLTHPLWKTLTSTDICLLRLNHKS